MYSSSSSSSLPPPPRRRRPVGRMSVEAAGKIQNAHLSYRSPSASPSVCVCNTRSRSLLSQSNGRPSCCRWPQPDGWLDVRPSEPQSLASSSWIQKTHTQTDEKKLETRREKSCPPYAAAAAIRISSGQRTSRLLRLSIWPSRPFASSLYSVYYIFSHLFASRRTPSKRE